jgi:transposase
MEIIVGIDVSKDRLDVHVLPSGAAFWVGNDQAGVEDLVQRLAALSPSVVALEATGGFVRLAVAASAGAGLAVVVVNPAHVGTVRNSVREAMMMERRESSHGY